MRNNLIIILNEKGWTQKKLSEELIKNGINADRTIINKIINSKRIPSLKLTFAISWALNYPIEKIFMPKESEIFNNGNNNNPRSR